MRSRSPAERNSAWGSIPTDRGNFIKELTVHLIVNFYLSALPLTHIRSRSTGLPWVVPLVRGFVAESCTREGQHERLLNFALLRECTLYFSFSLAGLFVYLSVFVDPLPSSRRGRSLRVLCRLPRSVGWRGMSHLTERLVLLLHFLLAIK